MKFFGQTSDLLINTRSQQGFINQQGEFIIQRLSLNIAHLKFYVALICIFI